MINTERNRGGAAKMAATLVNAINDYSEDVSARLVHCGDSNKSEKFIGLKRPLAFYANIVQTRLFGNHHVFDFGVCGEILKLAEKADVIHLHNLHGYYLDFVKLIQHVNNMPVVWTWHDMWGATGRCGFSMECNEWRNGCLKCEYLSNYPEVWLDHAASEYKMKSELFFNMRNLHIVSPSSWLQQIAIKRGFDVDNTSIIPNPVDLSSYKPLDKSVTRSKLGLSEDPLLLFVAHNCNDQRKRYKDFEQIINSTGYSGLVVGVPPEIKHERIRYLGKLTDSKQMTEAYSTSDAFVITSSVDNYPNTVIESMACGTPVFGYAIGGIPSQMPDGWEGLVEYLDISSLSNKIVNYIADNGSHEEVKARCTEHAIKNWHPANVAEKYIHTYQSVLNAIDS